MEPPCAPHLDLLAPVSPTARGHSGSAISSTPAAGRLLFSTPAATCLNPSLEPTLNTSSHAKRACCEAPSASSGDVGRGGGILSNGCGRAAGGIGANRAMGNRGGQHFVFIEASLYSVFFISRSLRLPLSVPDLRRSITFSTPIGLNRYSRLLEM